MGRISKVGPTTDSRPVPIKKGVFAMCSLVTCNAVAIPVVMKAVLIRYSVRFGSKLKAPAAIASGGETIDPIIVRACCKPSVSVKRIGTLSWRP